VYRTGSSPQNVLVTSLDTLGVGITATVYGSTDPNERAIVKAVKADGEYAAGSTVVFISGTIQKTLPNVGRIVVSGLTVDLTGTMWNGIVWPSLGSRVEVTGTQPIPRGLILATHVNFGKVRTNGISDTGAGSNGINGGVSSDGISGTGRGTQGISGGGAASNGIGGGDLGAQGINGGGAASNGISGGGVGAQGISGGGAASNGISGTGHST
jgi:hypothetical protein